MWQEPVDPGFLWLASQSIKCRSNTLSNSSIDGRQGWGGGCRWGHIYLPPLKRSWFRGHAMEAPIWLRRKQHDMCFMYTCISHTPCTLLRISLLLSELMHLLVVFLGERRTRDFTPYPSFCSLRAWSSCFSNSTLPRGWLESFDRTDPTSCGPFFFEKDFWAGNKLSCLFLGGLFLFAQKRSLKKRPDNNNSTLLSAQNEAI